MGKYEFLVQPGIILFLAALGKIYLEKRIQNLATAQDVGKIESEVQKIRFEYQRMLDTTSAAVASSSTAHHRVQEIRIKNTAAFVKTYASHLHTYFLIFDHARLLRLDYEQLAAHVGAVQKGFADITDSWLLMLALETDHEKAKLCSACLTSAHELHNKWRRQIAPVLMLTNSSPEDWRGRIKPLKELATSTSNLTQQCLEHLMTVISHENTGISNEQHVNEAIESILRINEGISKGLDSAPPIDSSEKHD